MIKWISGRQEDNPKTPRIPKPQPAPFTKDDIHMIMTVEGGGFRKIAESPRHAEMEQQ